MTSVESMARDAGIAEPWILEGGVHWLNPGAMSVRDVASWMNENHARFVTITTYELPATEGFRLEYHWDIDGQLLGFSFRIPGNSVPSIFDLCEGADWIEREIHEEYAIDFTGRVCQPLLLREGNALGVNLREAGGAGQAEPQEAAR
ncbi:MAG TPA: NADH-quinone oxidoreductase subunit C [Terracidiphilus sp.]|nr:NADH-quinone oxidoreductase subunit C [Terracidiphilus sp.]